MEERRLLTASANIASLLMVEPVPMETASAELSSVPMQLDTGSYSLSEVPELNSLPGAAASLYLDFNGFYETDWGGYDPGETLAYTLDSDASTFDDAELASIEKIWAIVAEDYAPFDLNVTTVEPPSFADGVALRVVIGGTTSNWLGYGPVAGVGYIDSFTNPSLSNSVYMFSTDSAGPSNYPEEFVAQTISHESGHGFGLYHQAAYDEFGELISEYGGAEPGRAAIMGGGLDLRATWWYGTSSVSAVTFQDDMAVLAGTTNGFGYRTDDFGNSTGAATALVDEVATDGIITTMEDVDYFSIEIDDDSRLTVTVDLPPFNNLDATLELRDSEGDLILSAAPTDDFGAKIVAELAPGQYYLVIGSEGGYGDVGQYTITADVLPAAVAGTVYDDANYNGELDLGEDGLAGWQVYDDRNENGMLDAPYESVWDSTDTPLTLMSEPIRSELTINGLSGTIVDLNIRLSLAATGAQIYLYDPDGRYVGLMGHDAGTGAEFIDTRFDDDATLFADEGTSPFTGSFKPGINALSLFNGADPNGVWYLEVTGGYSEGSLVDWSLEFTTTSELTATTDANGEYFFAFPDDGSHHIRQVGQSPYVATAPVGGVHDVETGGAKITDLDFGNVLPAVLNRALFYNQSGTSSPVRYDGNDPAINSSDDQAIATDKVALLPGQTATFANVSSYSKGINGIMVDIFGSSGTVSASDFIFRVGNNNSPSTWSTAPAPSSISVRAGAGVSGSDRVTITWANGDIKKQWLEVIVKANANTNLPQNPNLDTGQADAFFFGNALGDTGQGDSSTQATVSATDDVAINNNNASVFSNIPITNIYDINRDGAVNATDELLAHNNPTSIGNVTKFITVSSPPSAPNFAATAPLTGIASALTAPTIDRALPGESIPRAAAIRYLSADVSSRPPGTSIQQLPEMNSPAARKSQFAVDQLAQQLGLDDAFLDALMDNFDW